MKTKYIDTFEKKFIESLEIIEKYPNENDEFLYWLYILTKRAISLCFINLLLKNHKPIYEKKLKDKYNTKLNLYKIDNKLVLFINDVDIMYYKIFDGHEKIPKTYTIHTKVKNSIIPKEIKLEQCERKIINFLSNGDKLKVKDWLNSILLKENTVSKIFIDFIFKEHEEFIYGISKNKLYVTYMSEKQNKVLLCVKNEHNMYNFALIDPNDYIPNI